MSWKKQGGTNRLDSTSNVNVNSVVANKFTIKDYFYGDMNVLGNINAEGSMKVKGNLLAAYVGAENIFANITLRVLRNATVYGSMAVKKDMYVYERQILGNIERNNNIVTIFNNDSITGNLGITQAKILDSRTGVAEYYYDGHIGFGTNNPLATLDITGNIPLTFAVRTDGTNNYSVISRNNEDTGVVAHTDLATAEIQFFKETPIPTDISGATPDARIQYIEGGVLAVEAADSVITYSKGIFTTRNADQTINNSAVSIYDIESGTFAYDTYNANSSKQYNAISIGGADSSSMSMIHFTNSETNSGISIGGGAYPPNINQRMGTIGYTQPDGTYAPAINIVSSDTNRLFHRTTVGINTQYPRTDEYVMDINGPVIIRSTTETNVVKHIPFEIDVLKHCRSDHNYIIAVGKPYTVAGDPDTFYTDQFGSTVTKNYQQKVYFTRNMGQTWSQSNFNETDIGLLADNEIHAAYALDASLCFVCTQRGFMYYSVNGGTVWYGIAGIPYTDNIHSVFLTDHFVVSHSVYRVFVCGKTQCTWFDMPTSYYLVPTNFTIYSMNHGSFNFPGECTIADGLDQLMYITVANSIYSYNIGNYVEPIISNISSTYTGGDSYNSVSLGSQNVAMFVGPGIITYTTDGGDTYNNITQNTDPILEGGKMLNSVFLENESNALITGYDNNGAFFLFSQDQFQTFYPISVEDLRNFGAPPHVLTSTNLYDAFLVSPESIMFFDIVETYNASTSKRGQSVIYNLYIPHILSPLGSRGLTRATSDGVAFRIDYGRSEFAGSVVMEKDITVSGNFYASNTTVLHANVEGSTTLSGPTTVSGGLDMHSRLNIYDNISANGVLITPQQLGYINGVSEDIQTQLDNKVSKTENSVVSGNLTFSGDNTFSGTNTFSGINQFDNLVVSSTGITTVVSPETFYTISPTRLSYLRNVSSDVQTQLNDKLSLSAENSVLNGIYTFNGEINIANTVVVADNSILSPADFGAMRGATSNFQAQLDIMKIAMDSISGGSASEIMNAAMVSNVALNTFTVPNRFNADTTIVGNVIANYSTITPTQLSYLSSLTSNIQTQLNNRVELNATHGIDLVGAVVANNGFTTTADMNANIVKSEYQVLSGHANVASTEISLTAAQSGSVVNITASQESTITLPSPTTAGLCFTVCNSSNFTSTILSPNGMFVPYPDADTLSLLPDATVQLRSNGTDWFVVGGTYDCARLSLPNFSLADFSTTGSVSAGTNITVGNKAAIGHNSVSSTAALDVSGNVHVKGNSFIEGQHLTWGNIDVSGAVSVSDSLTVGSSAEIGNYLAIGKTHTTGIELDVSGDAFISNSMSIGKVRNPDYTVDISGGIHGTSIAIDEDLSVGGAISSGSSLSVLGTSSFTGNVGIGKHASTHVLDVSGDIAADSIHASTLTLSGNPIGGFALDMSGSIRAKNITLTDGVGLPSGGVADTALTSNVALLNRSSQEFSGENSFKYISVGGATKPTGTTTYSLDISGGLRVMSGSVVLPTGSITTNNLPPGVCIKEGNNLYLIDPAGGSPYLGIGKGAMQTQYNIDVNGTINSDGPIYTTKMGINKKGSITSGVDVDISGTASISNTLTVGNKLIACTPSTVVGSATISKRSGTYDLYWATANPANLSTQLSGAFTAINMSSRLITYTPVIGADKYSFTFVCDYATSISNHPTITVYPNYVSALNKGTGYIISLPNPVQRGSFSVNPELTNGLTTGTMYVDIGSVGSGTVPVNLVANSQSIVVCRLASTTNTTATDDVPICLNGSTIFNSPTRFAGGIYADSSQTVHFGSNAPIMSGSNILPGTIPSAAFATSGVDLDSEQTVLGAKTFGNNLTVSSPYNLLVGTTAVNTNRNPVVKLDVSGGIQASQYMSVGKATLINMTSQRPDNVAFYITNLDLFGIQSSASSVRTFSVNQLLATLPNNNTISMERVFAVSGYYTFTMSYTPTDATARFTSNVGLTIGSVSATLNLMTDTTASTTVYIGSAGIHTITFTHSGTMSAFSVSNVSFIVEFNYNNLSSLEYDMAVNGDQAVFGKIIPYFGIDASAIQTINFGTNAPIMSGAGISGLPDTALSANIAKLNSAQTYSAKPKYAAGIDVSGVLTAEAYSGDGTGLTGIAKLASSNTFTNDQTMSNNLTVSGIAYLNGGITSTNTNGIQLNSNVRLNNNTIYFRPDTNHGIKYVNALIGSSVDKSVDGVKVFGFGGGVLTTIGTVETDILQWTRDNVVLFKPMLKDGYFFDTNGTRNNIRISKSNLSAITGTDNIGMGLNTLNTITSGSGNVGIGSNALSSITATKSNNVAIGKNALSSVNGDSNTAIGSESASGVINGSNNTFIGANTGVDVPLNTYTNSTAIGSGAKITANNTIVLGTSAETVRVPGSMSVSGTLTAAIPPTSISGTGNLSIPNANLSCANITAQGNMSFSGGNFIVEPGSTNNGTFIYSTNRTAYPYINIINSNVSLVSSSNTTAWNITNAGDATFRSITTTQPLSLSNISGTTISCSGTMTVNTLNANGTSTFTGATTHNGGITTTTLTASGLSTLSSLTVSGASTFTNPTTHNGGLTATTGLISGTLGVGGRLTASGGITANMTQTIDFGSNAPTMSGANIANSTIKDDSIQNSANYLRKNTTNNMSLSSGDYFQCMKSNNSGYIFINSGGSIGFWNTQTPISTWVINPDGASTLNSLSVRTTSTFTGATTHNGINTTTLTASGLSTLSTLSVSGTSTFSSSSTFTGGITTNTLTTSGLSTLSSLSVSGASTFSSASTFTSGITTTTLTASGLSTLSSLSVSGESTFTNPTTHNGGMNTTTLTASGASTFTGATRHNSGINTTTLTASGASTFTGATTHNGGMNTTTLTASGASTFTGATTHNGGMNTTTLTASGASTFTGATTHNGGITTTTLTSSGLSTLSSLSVSGNVAVSKSNSDAASIKLSTTVTDTNTAAYAAFYIYTNVSSQFAIAHSTAANANPNNATNITTNVFLNYTSTSWQSVSDIRLKKDIVSIDTGLDSILKLRPVSFKYKTDEDTLPPRLGFIAQEVQEVLPTIINESEDSGMLGLSMTEMTPHMVKAIQELHDENAKQKSEIVELRSEIAELRSLVQSLLNK